ncbi:TMEM175 family protein [Pseudonocardia acidicola]|uniref:DUF1211 domain-containing protein n=1 Tax=Pseudonocardia acidicola TaxID=2724939 RepID=A0ABX1S8C0_9PSEU|nr:TMEM175 family protein [Pseudonocardia acidicola]NMH97810.1 DUF1211 domain-containing protein [Pseudonocardia acidicola]
MPENDHVPGAPEPDDAGGVRLSGTNRVEAFSDGVLAIVITLLVLDLRVPPHPPGGLLTALLQQWTGYVAYLASFLYVGVIWLNHHAAFNRIRYVDLGLHCANLGLLLTTAVLPFPTAVVSATLQEGLNTSDARVAVGFYALAGMVMCVSWLLFYAYVYRHADRLLEQEVPASDFGEHRVRAWAGILGYGVAGVLGIAAPSIALGVFVLLPLFYAISSEGLHQLQPKGILGLE